VRKRIACAALAVVLGWPGLPVFAPSASASGPPCLPGAAPARGAAATEGLASVPGGVSCPLAFPGLSNFAEVSRGRLYRSSQPTPGGLALAKERFGIRTVVNLRVFHSNRKEAEALGLQYHRIPFAAWHVTSDEVVRFLWIVSDPANHPILVHCQHGADRTGAMVAAYRIFAQGWETERAIEELPRFGFHAIYANLKTFLRDGAWRRAAEEAGIPKESTR